MVLERAFLEATKTYLHLPDSVWERIFAFLPADALGSVYTCGSRRLQKLLQERQRKGGCGPRASDGAADSRPRFFVFQLL